MLPYPNLIRLDRNSTHPIYLQIVNQFVLLIQNGTLAPAAKLPGSRKLAQSLGIHRNTVVKSLEELEALGWIEIKPSSGAFVVESFPLNQPNAWQAGNTIPPISPYPAFDFYEFPHLKLPSAFNQPLAFDDGIPDIRLAPVDELARAYSRNMKRLARKKALTYTDGRGNPSLKKQLVSLLNETRGLNIREEHVLITRGTIMAIYLSVAVSVRAGDKVVVGESNYETANVLLKHVGAQLLHIPVDHHGILVSTLDEMCKNHVIRAVYVTSHHHHPTTVTLSPERRMQLLRLAEKYNFVILEDDYDYDYHYKHAPILPLASGDRYGRVFYFGSFTKIVAPAFRVGYLIGPPRVIQELPKLRRFIDRQGDMVLEQSIADLIEDGTMRRHLKKTWKIYRDRRDYCCEILENEFSDYLEFRKPAGGMAIWTQFDRKINLPRLSKELPALGLHLSSGSASNEIAEKENACRLGFASLNFEELDRAFALLKQGIQMQLGKKNK